MHHRARSCLVLGAALTVAMPVAVSQVERTGGGASQKIMQQYQQLAAEKTALQAQVEQLKKDLDGAHAEAASLKKERDGAKSHAGGSVAEITQAKNAKEAADQALQQSKQRLSELVTRFREMAQNFKETESDRAKLRNDLTRQNQAFDTCAQNNLGLYEITNEVLDRYEHTGLLTRVSATEPFTKITRNRIENLVDDYRARAQELRLQKQARDTVAAKPVPR